MAICETCDYANRPPYKSPCSECDKTIGSPFCCYEHEEKPTNADRIRSMTDDELNELFYDIYNAGAENAVAYEWGQRVNSFEWTMEWLQKPSKGE